MIPWLLFWSPTFTFPFGGAVNQKIEPDTNWFFNAIPPHAGNAHIEKRAFEVASYGRQLGLMIDILQDLSKQLPPVTDKGKSALSELEEIKNKIEKIKADSKNRDLEDFDEIVKKLKNQSPEKIQAAKAILEQALSSQNSSPSNE